VIHDRIAVEVVEVQNPFQHLPSLRALQKRVEAPLIDYNVLAEAELGKLGLERRQVGFVDHSSPLESRCRFVLPTGTGTPLSIERKYGQTTASIQPSALKSPRCWVNAFRI
jgi:hypothetical protein